MKFNLVNNNSFKQGAFNLRINTSGVDTETYFKNNPMLLYNHDKDKVIGKWKNLSLDNGVLVGEVEFANDDYSKEIRDKVSEGYLNSVSPGLEILETSYNEDLNELIVDKSTLLEGSIVSIPANPENSKNNETEFKKDEDYVLLLGNDNNELNLNKLITNKKSEIMAEKTEKTLEDLKAEKLELSSKVENFEKQVENLNSKVEEKDNKLTEKDNKIKELEDKVAEFNKEKMENLIDSAVSDGKISEESKSEFMELSYDKAKSILDKLSNDGSMSLSKTMEQGKSNEEHKDFEWYLDNDKEGLMKLEKESPEMYKKLQKEYLNKIKK